MARNNLVCDFHQALTLYEGLVAATLLNVVKLNEALNYLSHLSMIVRT